MIPKVIAFLLTLIGNAVIAVAVLFVLVIAMNGYGESDAMYGLGIYIALAIFTSITISGLSLLLLRFFRKRELSAMTAVPIAVIVLSVIGGILIAGWGIIGILVAEFARKNF